jgi:DNA-binding NarL/FixJ family response regulator
LVAQPLSNAAGDGEFVSSQEDNTGPDLYQRLLERELQLREVVGQMQQLLKLQAGNTAADSRKQLGAALSPREHEVLRLIAEGATNQQIGRELRLSPGTVRNYNCRIFRKLGVASRTQAAVRAIELQIVSRPQP